MIETIAPEWDSPARVRALCTTRVGGESPAPYDEFNLGMHLGDDVECVARNRARLREQMNLPAEPDWIRQTHGIRAVVLESDRDRDADAAITRQPGRVAAVMVADCLPLLVCNRGGSEVAAIHAGWRGLRAGVIASALDAMQSPPDALQAWIGPAISQAHFEVGDEVYSAFVEASPESGRCFVANRRGHWLCDLRAIARQQLAGYGVATIECDSHCTYRDRDLFFSYRRDGLTGRQAAMIWIEAALK